MTMNDPQAFTDVARMISAPLRIPMPVVEYWRKCGRCPCCSCAFETLGKLADHVRSKEFRP